MSGLFGNVGTTAATTAATNTTGDISKDVVLNSPPEDSISDLAFSPVSNHLAVASWDKKVRIYEINDQGQSEGKALFEHEAPVLNCCWSPVRTQLFVYSKITETNDCRMEQKSSEPEQIKLRGYWI